MSADMSLGSVSRSRSSSISGLGQELDIAFDARAVVEYLTRELSDLDRSAAVKKGLQKAARIYIAKGRSNLASRLLYHGSKGRLMRSFRVAWKNRLNTAYAGFRRGAKADESNAGWHAHLVDMGSGPRYTKSGAYRGIMPANYFWSSARESERGKAYGAVVEGVKTKIREIQSRLL